MTPNRVKLLQIHHLASFSRLLEEGNVDGAEEQKQRIEQLQRDRRKVLHDNHMTHQPRFFK